MREMWFHTHDAMIEDETAVRSIWWAAFHASLSGHGERKTWLHLAPPTPVIVDDRRLQLCDVRLRFRTSGSDAWIGAVHVYDGERCVAQHNGWLGASRDWRVRRFPVSGRPFLQWGIGVSLHLIFHTHSTGSDEQHARRIDLAAIGCGLLAPTEFRYAPLSRGVRSTVILRPQRMRP